MAKEVLVFKKDIMNKYEAEITPFVNKWMLEIIPEPAPWEIKHTRGKDRFPMSELMSEERIHEHHSLMASTTPRGFVYKIPDLGSYNPFDSFGYKNSPAYVVIVYPDIVIAIHVHKIDITVKSISREEAIYLSDFTIALKEIKRKYK